MSHTSWDGLDKDCQIGNDLTGLLWARVPVPDVTAFQALWLLKCRSLCFLCVSLTDSYHPLDPATKASLSRRKPVLP